MGVTYIAHNVCSGACVARNTGLNVAQGEYIGFLDEDDEWCPEKLEKLQWLKIYNRDPQYCELVDKVEVKKYIADLTVLPPKPVNLDKMIELAKQLSAVSPFLRVDFYEINGRLYFGELTFFPGSGFTALHPEEWNGTLGDWIKLPNKLKK